LKDHLYIARVSQRFSRTARNRKANFKNNKVLKLVRLFSSFGLPAAVLALLNRYLPVFLGLAASSVYLLSKYRGKRIFPVH